MLVENTKYNDRKMVMNCIPVILFSYNSKER